MAEFSLTVLKDEVDIDPETLGTKNSPTSGDWKGDQIIADLLNAKSYTVDKQSIPMELVRSGVTYDAYNNLAIDEQEWIQWMTPNGGQLAISADVKLQLSGRVLCVNGVPGVGADSDSFWAAADDQDMAPLFLSAIEAAGSRAEVLWGFGVTITSSQVGQAFNLI